MSVEERSVYLLFREKYWYIFPSLVFRFFIQEWKEERLYLASLSEWEKKEIKRKKLRHLLAFSTSFILHSVFFLFLFYDFVGSVLIGESEVVAREAIDFDIMDGMISSDLDPVYDESSDFVIKPSALIKKEDRKKLSLGYLLDKLRASKNPVLSRGSLRKSKKEYASNIGREEQRLKSKLGWSGRKKRKKKIKPLQVQLWDRMKLLKSKATEAQVNYGDIMKVIDKHNFQFQECYERALLIDEKLSGKVTFLLKLNHSKVRKAGLELKGKGSSGSQRELTRCLFRESKSLLFPKNRQKISIKFNLIFGI